MVTLSVSVGGMACTGDELRQKIRTEKREIERLQQDFADLQMIREDMYDSDDSSSSSSSDESDDDDDDLRDILQQLLRENADLEVCHSLYRYRVLQSVYLFECVSACISRERRVRTSPSSWCMLLMAWHSPPLMKTHTHIRLTALCPGLPR